MKIKRILPKDNFDEINVNPDFVNRKILFINMVLSAFDVTLFLRSIRKMRIRNFEFFVDQ